MWRCRLALALNEEVHSFALFSSFIVKVEDIGWPKQEILVWGRFLSTHVGTQITTCQILFHVSTAFDPVKLGSQSSNPSICCTRAARDLTLHTHDCLDLILSAVLMLSFLNYGFVFEVLTLVHFSFERFSYLNWLLDVRLPSFLVVLMLLECSLLSCAGQLVVDFLDGDLVFGLRAQSRAWRSSEVRRLRRSIGLSPENFDSSWAHGCI